MKDRKLEIKMFTNKADTLHKNFIEKIWQLPKLKRQMINRYHTKLIQPSATTGKFKTGLLENLFKQNLCILKGMEIL